MSVTGADFFSAAGTSASVSAAKAKSEENSTLSMNDFFTLLSAQMQNQTMYDSVDTSDYMAQLVQYTTLAQLQELTASAATSYAVSLIGKNVELLGKTEDGEDAIISGAVEQVAFDGGKPYVCVGGVYYEASGVLAVSAGETAGEAAAEAQAEAGEINETEGASEVTEVSDDDAG